MQRCSKALTKWIILPLIGLCGCSSVSLVPNDYTDNADTYADSSNKQLLLNLARLNNDEPIYFVQLGSISSQYQFNTTAGFNPTGTRTDPVAVGAVGMVQHALTFGGSLTAGATATPLFQYLPLTGTNFVQAILSPISDRVYLTLYDQGYAADQIVRTMIASVEWQHIMTNAVHLTTNNVPHYQFTTNYLVDHTKNPPAINTNITTDVVWDVSTNYILTTNYDVMVNNPHDLTYPDFLAFCTALRNAQICQMLSVDNQTGDTTTNVVYGDKKPKLADVATAIQGSLSVKVNDKNEVIVMQSTHSPEFVLKNPLEATNYTQFTDLLKIQTYDANPPCVKIANALKVARGIVNKEIRLKTVSFEGALYRVAKQQRYFVEMRDPQKYGYYVRSDIKYGQDTNGRPISVITGTDSGIFEQYRPLTVRPLMTLTYDYHQPEPKVILTKLKFDDDGKTYLVGDLSSETHDKTIFTMLSYLFAQTAISTQNLPVQQFIQVQ